MSEIKFKNIFFRQWGYEQTNVDFFIVVECVSQKVALVKKIEKIKTYEKNDPSSMSGVCVPNVPDVFIGPFETLRQRKDKFLINGEEFYKWNSEPVRFSEYA